MFQADMFPRWPDAARYQGGDPALAVSDREGFNIRWDAGGRWRSATLRGPLYQRALDGRILRRRRRGVDEPEAVPLGPEDVPRFHEAVRQSALELLSGEVRLLAIADAAPVEPVRAVLERATTWDAARFEEDRRRFAAIYGEVPPLPPDRVRALVVYWRDDPAEAERHLQDVRLHFGEALPLRQGVLLRRVPGPDLLAARLESLAAGFGSDLGIEVDAAALARFSSAAFGELAASRLRSIAVRFGAEAPGFDPEILGHARAAGLRWTFLLPGPDPSPLARCRLAASDLVHLPGAAAPSLLPARVVAGPLEEFLYYA